MAETAKKKPTINALVYGQAGSGKSILASTFPKPLIFDFDNGHKVYENQGLFPDATYVRGGKMIAMLSEAIKQIKEGKFKYETLVIDSLTNLENQAISRFKGMAADQWADNLYTNKGRKLGFDEWGSISSSTIAFLSESRELDVNVVVITQIDTYSDGGIEKFRPQLVGKGQNESAHFPDFMIYMERDEEGRVARLSSTTADRFVAKSRLGVSDVRPMRNPSYTKLLELIQKNKPKLDFSE